MSIKDIHLRKLLTLMFAEEPKRISILRADIRDEIKKIRGEFAGGGDFHAPFWFDAKNHVNGETDLQTETAARIASNPRRKRLYPMLEHGFLDWWNLKRRWTNEDPTSNFLSLKGTIGFPELDCSVKIENLLAMTIGNSKNRIIYPYFSEIPLLDATAARLGLWAMHESIGRYPSDEFRILDIIRGQSYSIADVPFQGNEVSDFKRRYRSVLKTWEELWKDYVSV